MWSFSSVIDIDAVGIQERVARLQTRSIKKETKVAALQLALRMTDLTTLEGKDTEGKVRQLCYKAMHPDDTLAGLPSVAAVCVYPTHVRTAKKCLAGSDVRVASVATGFPSGNTSLQIKLNETRMAVEAGADEVDMVIARGLFLEGKYEAVFKEIVKVKEACGKARLKVILETGELGTLMQVRKASELAILAGADFIKTSTGKISPAATLPVTLVMLQTIRDYYEQTGKQIGMKPAGGISNAKTALQYLVMLQEIAGDAWMHPHWFRFGASSLVNDLLMQLHKEQQGVYYAGSYLSND